MKPASIARALALAGTGTLLASLVLVSAAAPTLAAKQKCAGHDATIVGTNKSETINGTKGDDVISARGGNDRVLGRGGNDVICGGPGRDVLIGNGGKDFLFGARGADRVYGGTGDDRIFGGPGDDVLGGGLQTDLCRQGSGTGKVSDCERPKVAPTPEPKSAFQTTCEDHVGTYVETHMWGTLELAPACRWDGISSEDWSAANAPLGATCPAGSGLAGMWARSSDPDFLGCAAR